MVLNSIFRQGFARKSVYKCSKKLPAVGEQMSANMLVVLGAFMATFWELGQLGMMIGTRSIRLDGSRGKKTQRTYKKIRLILTTPAKVSFCPRKVSS